jgi:hypothetical protein
MAASKSGQTTLRRASLVLALALILQYALGMVVNIYATLPKDFQGVGLGKAFSDAMSKGPASLAMHTGLGLVLLVAAVWLLLSSLLSGHRVVLASSTVALLAIVGAAFSGLNFVNTTQNSASLTMALLTGVALLCAVVNLYVLGSGGAAQAAEPGKSAQAQSAEAAEATA